MDKGRIMLRADAPFVLLDDMAADAPARLYRDPVHIVRARSPEEVAASFQRLREAHARGLHAAGFLAFEAGHALEPRLPGGKDGEDLLWFGLFERYEEVAPRDLLPTDRAWAGPARPLVDETWHAGAVAQVHAAIAAGDIYQANLTFPAAVAVMGNPLALYAALRARAAAPWGGIVWTGARWLLSFSPELFFRLDEGQLTARPMKGTAPRDGDDAAARAALAGDPKQRAENLMIVDLIRNDLGRVAEPGSVAVPALFTVETYPTLHQMTSTVTAQLAKGRDATDVLAAAFPCGSVTGAPKIRACEIIAAVETGPRGLYCGSIGRWDADGNAAFNVAIRTLDLPADAREARLGLGSGIVADSDAAAEWRECLAKGSFLASPPPFDLLETMRFDPRDGLFELERHLVRLKDSAAALGFRCDRHAIRNELQAATFRLREPRRIRVRLSPTGAVAIEATALPVAPDAPVAVALAPLPLAPHDLRLRHKTSDRAAYDAARTAAGTWEAVFVDLDGFLTEGSFTALFVERDGRLLTPPLTRPLLPSVLRGHLLEEGRAIEADLTSADLAGGFLLGNALRGLIPARLVAGSATPGL